MAKPALLLCCCVPAQATAQRGRLLPPFHRRGEGNVGIEASGRLGTFPAPPSVPARHGVSIFIAAPPPMRYPLTSTHRTPLEGTMSFREQLYAYIAQLEQRLRRSTWLCGLAIFTGGIS